MSKPSKHVFWLIALSLIAVPAFGATPQATTAQQGGRSMATAGSGHSSGVMRVGLTLVAAQEAAAPLPLPAQLGHPASPSAVLCRSDAAGYRECLTPFRGPVLLSRELADARCIEGKNWGWREGAVWVDGGCSAVFLSRTAAAAPAA